MALNDTNSYLKDLINAGADAMTNLYYVKFSNPSIIDKDTSLSQSMTVRVNNITLPTATHSTSTKSFMTVSVDTPKSEIQITKKFDISFRLDDNYEIYKKLLSLQANTSKANLGYASNDMPLVGDNSHLSVSVYAIRQALTTDDQVDPDKYEGFYQKMYEFRDCWISSVKLDGYDYSNSNELTVTASIYFCDYDDPQSLLLENTTNTSN